MMRTAHSIRSTSYNQITPNEIESNANIQNAEEICPFSMPRAPLICDSNKFRNAGRTGCKWPIDTRKRIMND